MDLVNLLLTALLVASGFGLILLCDRLREATGIPVIDGVTAAIKLAEALVGAGYATSKVNSYDYPRVKETKMAACA